MDYKDRRSLIIYFSRADENYEVGYIKKGNTEVVAEYIKELTHADMFKVERKVPYAKEYNTCIQQAKKEFDNNILPEIKNYLTNIDKYEVIYIGSPVYWGHLPQPLLNQLERLHWVGKIVRPFTTHEGSELAAIPEQLKKICLGAEILDGLAIQGSKVNESKEIVAKWV